MRLYFDIMSIKRIILVFIAASLFVIFTLYLVTITSFVTVFIIYWIGVFILVILLFIVALILKKS